jgi:hypothetical protein
MVSAHNRYRRRASVIEVAERHGGAGKIPADLIKLRENVMKIAGYPVAKIVTIARRTRTRGRTRTGR